MQAIEGTARTTDRTLVVPHGMERIVATAGYVPAVAVGPLVFCAVKDRVFPRGTCAWTVISAAALAHPGLLAEVKCVAARRSATGPDPGHTPR